MYVATPPIVTSSRSSSCFTPMTSMDIWQAINSTPFSRACWRKDSRESIPFRFMNEFKYNIGYALSGGFIKGFAHLGIMQALHEHGIRPEILSGVSAGALAAVFYADGKEPYHIVELFEHHSFKELTTFSINKQGLLKLDSFIDFLNSNLESKTIEELKIPTIITATDLDHGRIVSFKKGKIAERLAASCCMPILFAPIRINNTYYVDGGILMNLPVSPIRKECEKVIALNVDPLVADEYSKNVVSIALRAYHFIFQANTLPQKGIADLLIESYGLEEYSNRELERAEEIFEKGYNTATELLDRLLLENGTIWR